MNQFVRTLKTLALSAGSRLGLLAPDSESVTVRADGSVAVLDPTGSTLRIYPACETAPAIYEVVADPAVGFRMQLKDRATGDVMPIATHRRQRVLARELQRLAHAGGAVKAPRSAAWGWGVAAIIGFVAITALGVPPPRAVHAAKPAAASSFLPVPASAVEVARPSTVSQTAAPEPALSISTDEFIDCGGGQ